MVAGNPHAAFANLDAEILRRLAKAAAYTAKELKLTVSVPAPRRVSKHGRPYATVPATPGAPPRKLSGRGRASIAWMIDKAKKVARAGVGTIYMPRHERTGHPWVGPTLGRIRDGVLAILGGQR